MKHKVYRICLLSLLVIALIGGIFCYQSMSKEEMETLDGTFVWEQKDITDTFGRTVYFDEKGV